MSKEVTPLYEQFLSIKEKYPDAVILWQCGDFFEAFDDDAKYVSELLKILLVDKAEAVKSIKGYKDTRKTAQFMAGFPSEKLNDYLPLIVKSGKSVAIVENVGSFGAKPINFKRDIRNAKKV